MSSVFNDSEGLYGTTVCRCLFRRPHYSKRLMLFRSRGPSALFSQIRHCRIGFTEKAWEDAVQGLGMARSTVASEKNRELLQGIDVNRQCDLQTVTSLLVVSLVFRGHVLKIANINPQQEASFSLCKNLVSRESGGSGA